LEQSAKEMTHCSLPPRGVVRHEVSPWCSHCSTRGRGEGENMKVLFGVLALFFGIAGVGTSEPTEGGWFWQNPRPQGNSLTGGSFVDASTGTVVGDLGTIVRTTDGGATWTQQRSGTTNGLLGVSFVDASTGTAVGEFGTIVRTTDGGATWTRQTSG